MIRRSFVCFLSFTLLLGIGYPFLVYGIGWLFFPKHAQGSLVIHNDTVVGSHWIAQEFQTPKYFHPRPSSANYDAAASMASNLGPTSQKLIDTLKQRATQYRLENKLAPNATVPADAVTASASGLDPHISIENAMIQAPRVAAARNKSVDEVKALIEKLSEGAFLGFLGTKRVNVLKINLALDQ